LLLWLIEIDVFKMPQLHKHFNVVLQKLQNPNMPKVLIGLSIIIYCLTQSCHLQTSKKSEGDSEQMNKQAPFYSNQLSTESPRTSKEYDSTKIVNYDPFILYKDGSYIIAAEIERKELLNKYQPIFEKYEYSGNGYSWEGHIKQILQEENPALLKHLLFDPEAGAFYVFADSEETQRQFAETLSQIFKDIPKLEKYLKRADREKIDD
jgi:hypothetical protein